MCATCVCHSVDKGQANWEAGAWAWLGTADKCKRHFRQRKSENGSKLNAQNLKGNRETETEREEVREREGKEVKDSGRGVSALPSVAGQA